METETISGDDSHTLIKAEKKMQTDKALLIKNVDGEKVWLPLSQIEIADTYPHPRFELNEVVEVLIPNWLATKKGF